MTEQDHKAERESARAMDGSALEERVADLDAEDEPSFLRGAKAQGRGRSTARLSTRRLRWIVLGLLGVSLLSGAAFGGWRWFSRTDRFLLSSSEAVEVEGLQAMTREEVVEIFGADIGRNVFFIPLDERRRALEQMPWIESATVMRILPNRIRVQVRERRPVAFARIGSEVRLIDASGALMPVPAPPAGQGGYWLPVIADMNANETAELRRAQVRLYMQLVGELDSEGGAYSRDLEEVYVSDPENVSALVRDPGGLAMLQMGSSTPGSGSFLRRFKAYSAYIGAIRRRTPNIDSIDLSVDNRYVVRPSDDKPPTSLEAAAADAAKPAAPTPSAVKSEGKSGEGKGKGEVKGKGESKAKSAVKAPAKTPVKSATKKDKKTEKPVVKTAKKPEKKK